MASLLCRMLVKFPRFVALMQTHFAIMKDTHIFACIEVDGIAPVYRVMGLQVGVGGWGVCVPSA